MGLRFDLCSAATGEPTTDRGEEGQGFRVLGVSIGLGLGFAIQGFPVPFVYRSHFALGKVYRI